MKERTGSSPSFLHKKPRQEFEKSVRKSKKPTRKTLLSDSTIALFFYPCHQSNGEILYPDLTANQLFDNLKAANKVIVKGVKVLESLEELKLSGVIFPFTLLLTGKYEDLKVIKQAWVKRHLKNPKGYFVKEIGELRYFIVQKIEYE